MISSVQNSAVSALQAFSTKIQSNSNNVANSLTDGYKKTRVTLSSKIPTGVEAQVEKVHTPGSVVFQDTGDGQQEVELSNVDIGQELPEMSMNSTMYKANLKTLQVADEMTGSLLKVKA